VRLISFLFLATLAHAADIGVVGGGGLSIGDDQDLAGHYALGVSARIDRFQFDYLKAGPHFVTGSYVFSGGTPRARPFFQLGAGVAAGHGDSSFAAVFAAGATIDLRRNLFLRPQVRLYGHVGPTVTIVPLVAVGWRL
jgi:hypothetical protein